MRVDDSSDIRPLAVDIQVAGCIRGWLKVPFHHLPLQVDHDDMLRAEVLVADPGGFDRYQPGFRVSGAHVTARPDHQPIAGQLQVEEYKFFFESF
jgi:hypothetical protein